MRQVRNGSNSSRELLTDILFLQQHFVAQSVLPFFCSPCDCGNVCSQPAAVLMNIQQRLPDQQTSSKHHVCCVLCVLSQATETLLTAVSWLKRELLGVNDGYELPAPQLPAKTGAASESAINAAAAKAAKQAAADLAEAEAEAA